MDITHNFRTFCLHIILTHSGKNCKGLHFLFFDRLMNAEESLSSAGGNGLNFRRGYGTINTKNGAVCEWSAGNEFLNCEGYAWNLN